MKPLGSWTSLVLGVVIAAGCGGAGTEGPKPPTPASACDAQQAALSRDADVRVERDEHDKTLPIAQHLAKHFPDGRVSWVMTEKIYKEKIEQPRRTTWGRCDDSGRTCYQFASPTAFMHDKVEAAKTDGRIDRAKLEEALGISSGKLNGPILIVTLDVAQAGTCVRLPVSTDLGALEECKTPDQKACFKFGGYTTGDVPEIMLINAPVDSATLTNPEAPDPKMP